MDETNKMYPSSLPKSTELAKTAKNNSTEISIIPSGEVVRARSNVTKVTGGGDNRIHINISSSASESRTSYSHWQSYSEQRSTSTQEFSSSQPWAQYFGANAGYTQNNNGSSNYESSPQETHVSTQAHGSGQGNGPRQNYTSQYDQQPDPQPRAYESNQQYDTKQQTQLLSIIVIGFFALLGLQIILSIVAATGQMLVQIAPTMLIIALLVGGGFLLSKKLGYNLLSEKDKRTAVKLMTSASTKMVSLSKGFYTEIKALIQSQGARDIMTVAKPRAKE